MMMMDCYSQAMPPSSYPESYTLSGCRVHSTCGTFTRTLAHCTNRHSDHCPGGKYDNGNTDPTLCDNAPVYRKGDKVFYRIYIYGGTEWHVGLADFILADCSGERDPGLGDPIHTGSHRGPTGYPPTADVYRGSVDLNANGGFGVRDTISIVAGDGAGR